MKNDLMNSLRFKYTNETVIFKKINHVLQTLKGRRLISYHLSPEICFLVAESKTETQLSHLEKQLVENDNSRDSIWLPVKCIEFLSVLKAFQYFRYFRY